MSKAEETKIAALFVEKNGHYKNLPKVEPWTIELDARNYQGPYSVVAHPPCSRWCRLAGLVEKRWGHKRGDDGGCFESALNSVRTYGGILEHPAYSEAFYQYGLPIPTSYGGWQKGICGGWACHVDQGNYGHRAKKATWLYVFGTDDLPSLNWQTIADNKSEALVSWCGNKVKRDVNRPRLGKKEASSTPIAFRDLLIDIARRCYVKS